MIWESYYWKIELQKIAKQLERRKRQTKWYDASFANVEKEIMLSAFMVRKLFDSDKIDKRIDDKEIDIVIYKSNGKKINRLKTHHPEQYFVLKKPIKSKMKVRDICNQIIHSYIFTLVYNEANKFESIFVASDYKKFRYLVELTITKYISIINKVSNYKERSVSYIFDDRINDYIVTHNIKSSTNKKYKT